MSSRMTLRDQKKVSFTDEELERIVSYIPYEEKDQNASFVDDENVVHRGMEIYSRLGVVSEIFQFNFDVEEMMMRYDVKIPQNIVFQLVLRRIINHLLFN